MICHWLVSWEEPHTWEKPGITWTISSHSHICPIDRSRPLYLQNRSRIHFLPFAFTTPIPIKLLLAPGTSHLDYCKTSFLASSNAPVVSKLHTFQPFSYNLFHTGARMLFLKIQSSHEALPFKTFPWLPISLWIKLKYLPMAIKAMVNLIYPTALNSYLPYFPATVTFPDFSFMLCALELSTCHFPLL